MPSGMSVRDPRELATLGCVAITAKQLSLKLSKLRTGLDVLATGWEAKVNPELRHAARHAEINSCTRLVTGPGYPGQAAFWAMVPKRLVEAPGLLASRLPNTGELSGRGSRSEIVVDICGVTHE